MKHGRFVLFCIVCFLVSVYLTVDMETHVAKGDEKMDGISVYMIPEKEYMNFTTGISYDALVDSATTVQTFRLLESGRIERIQMTDSLSHTQRDEFADGTIRIGNIAMSSSLLEFLGSKASIDRFLSENNVECHCEKISLICIEGLPCFAWVNSAPSDFVITINEFPADVDSLYGYVYRLYLSDDFSNKLLFKEAKVTIEGSESSVKIRISSYCTEVPMIALLSELGAEIVWHDQYRQALINWNGGQYTLDVSERSFVAADDNKNLLAVPPGSFRIFKCLDGEIWVDEASIEAILGLAGLTLEVNYCDLCAKVIMANNS